MSRLTRRAAADAVKIAFLPVEKAAQLNAAAAGQCIATMIEQRFRARLPANVGADALAFVAKGVELQVAAANAFADAHKAMAGLPSDLGFSEFFQGPECEPNESGHLRVVPAA